MSSPQNTAEAPLDLSKYRSVPKLMIAVGGVIALLGLIFSRQQFGYSWLLAFMFFLSFGLGALFLVILNHLFDAMWILPFRRFVEHIACLLPLMFFLFIPIMILAPLVPIYSWMDPAHAKDHALMTKQAFLNLPMWYGRIVLLFAIWWWLTSNLRKWSLKQDQTGAAECTIKMRWYSCIGVVLFSLTLTTAAIDWMKSLEYQWFSTMYGVYYFGESVWTSLITFYVIGVILKRLGPLRHVARPGSFHDMGVLFFAFTVFYAYIHFSQYFLIWNAALPEETFWYIQRETGSWWGVGMLIVFGHFVLPFLAILRIDAKLNLAVMVPLCLWAWLCHFFDMSYNIMPVIHPDGFKLHILDLACLAVIGGILAEAFIRSFQRHPPYPQRDPRIAETMGVYLPPASEKRPATAHTGAK